MTKQEKKETTGSMEERRVMRAAASHNMIPVTWLQYEAGWAAFREKPTVAAVAEAASIPRAVAAHLIEVGYPKHEMPAYGERLASVRRVARKIEDYNTARAMSENSQILRGIKFKLRTALGPKFENVNFSKEALNNLTPRQALVFMQFMDKLVRLEAFTLHEGADQTRVKIEHNVNNSDPTEAASKLATLLKQIESAVEQSPFSSDESGDQGGIIDAEFVESAIGSEESEGDEESEEGLDFFGDLENA